MATRTIKTGATVEDLYDVPDEGKAEIVGGKLVLMSPTGDMPSRAAGNIYISLRQYEREAGEGRAYTDNTGFVVWDVDLLGDEVIKVYRADDPDTPTAYRRGDVAEAEPALPGWRMPVDDLFT